MRAWRALGACVLTIVLAAGTRTSYAAFLRPIEADLGLDRATLSAASALMLVIYGLCQPLVGTLATRFEPRFVMMAGVALLCLGGFGVAAAREAWHLFLFAGVVPGFAFGAATGLPATVLMARWFDRRFGLATGIISSAVPAGHSSLVPVAAALIPLLGWRQTYVALGFVLAGVTLPLLWAFAREPRGARERRRGRSAQAPPTGADVWLVAAGFFGCGFTDQFVTLHLVALATEAGLEPLVAAAGLSALMLLGIAGSMASGPLADRYPVRLLLAGMYGLRTAALPLLLLVGPGAGAWALVAFALLFGVTYIANQAPGARLVRDRYGVQAVGALMGRVGLAHQLGGAGGMLAGGLSVTLAGGYEPSVLLATGVVALGGGLQLLIAGQKSRP